MYTTIPSKGLNAIIAKTKIVAVLNIAESICCFNIFSQFNLFNDNEHCKTIGVKKDKFPYLKRHRFLIEKPIGI